MNNITVTPNGVIIPYEAWENYWKKLSEDFQKTKNELHDIQSSKSVTIRLEMRSYRLDSTSFNSHEYVQVGVINPTIQKGYEVEFDIDAHNFKRRVRELIEKDSYPRIHEKFYSIQDIEDKIVEHNKTVEKIISYSHQIVKQKQEYDYFISKLPFIVKWLFRLNKAKK